MFPVALIVAMMTSQATWHWVALSKTAMSITGDVTFAATRMTFQNGQAIDLGYIGMRTTSGSDKASFGDAAHYRLYKITTDTNPTLLNGNKLCGPRPTYLTIAYQGVPKTTETNVFAAFYTGSAPPAQGKESSMLCATYTYELK